MTNINFIYSIVAAETTHENMFKEYQAKTKESFQRKSQKAIEAHTKASLYIF